MDDTRDLLVETFEAHEHLAPDAADVLSNVDAIARNHRRNRWIVRATGVSLVSAGVVAGAIAVPGLVSGRSTTSSVQAATGAGSSPAADPSSYTQAQELAAYFQSGYDYNNAVDLARLWNESDATINKTKAEAGLKLLEGETLPVQPNNAPAPPEDKAVAAFFAAGYDYNDAVQLAKIWHDTQTYQAKVQGGQKLENGEPLPFPPSGNTSQGSPTPTSVTLSQKKALAAAMKDGQVKPGADPTALATPDGGGAGMTSQSLALTAYFNAGYDYNDAVKLSQIWHESDIGQVKADAGQKLLSGDTLPVAPSGTPASPEDKAVTAFFAGGYDYTDAVKLGKLWHETDTYQVKVEAGQKLENGGTLPIPPSS
jgi:hypothetical protein